jgi:hypothetical protein
MLKIEKKARTREIQISLRDREKLFNPNFRNAFLIALALHLFGIVFFNIVPLKIAEGKILPPSAVEAELASTESPESLILAQIEGEKRDPRYQLAPKGSSPELPALAKFSFLHKMEYMKQNSLEHNPFAQIEKELQESYFTTQVLPADYTPVEIFFSGTEGNRVTFSLPAEFASFFSKRDNSRQALTRHRALYEIRIQNTSGEVFWIEKREETPIAALNQLSEKILHALKFANLSQALITKGLVEIIFTFNEHEPLL